MNKRYNINLNEEDLKVFDKVSKEEGKSRSQKIRELIKEENQKKGKK